MYIHDYIYIYACDIMCVVSFPIWPGILPSCNRGQAMLLLTRFFSHDCRQHQLWVIWFLNGDITKWKVICLTYIKVGWMGFMACLDFLIELTSTRGWVKIERLREQRNEYVFLVWNSCWLMRNVQELHWLHWPRTEGEYCNPWTWNPFSPV